MLCLMARLVCSRDAYAMDGIYAKCEGILKMIVESSMASARDAIPLWAFESDGTMSKSIVNWVLDLLALIAFIAQVRGRLMEKHQVVLALELLMAKRDTLLPPAFHSTWLEYISDICKEKITTQFEHPLEALLLWLGKISGVMTVSAGDSALRGVVSFRDRSLNEYLVARAVVVCANGAWIPGFTSNFNSPKCITEYTWSAPRVVVDPQWMRVWLFISAGVGLAKTFALMMGGEPVAQWLERMKASNGIDEFDLGNVRLVLLLRCKFFSVSKKAEDREASDAIEKVAKYNFGGSKFLLSLVDEPVAPKSETPDAPEAPKTPLQEAIDDSSTDVNVIVKLCAESSQVDIDQTAGDFSSWRDAVNSVYQTKDVGKWQAFSSAMLRSRKVDVVLHFLLKHADDLAKMPPITNEHFSELHGDPRLVLALVILRPLSEPMQNWLAYSTAWSDGALPLALTEKIITKEFLKKPDLVQSSTVVLWRLSRRDRKFFALPK